MVLCCRWPCVVVRSPAASDAPETRSRPVQIFLDTLAVDLDQDIDVLLLIHP